MKTLGRKKAPREALLRSLATSLVLYEKIETTEAKAKVLRPYVEKMITLGKKNTLHARRQLLAKLYLESAVKKMLDELSPRYKERKGGYLRIVKLGFRQGDAAKMVKIEFVGREDQKTIKQESKKKGKK
ncbi:50S ribosomal protein L17 [Patescibacteria group bacterium]|nr:50S ribosomal protein L17 [Patescibacteria group bacterium]